MDRQRLADLFDRAVAMAPEQRPAWLAAECGNDAEMRAEVERLLRADADAAGFLETPPQLLSAAASAARTADADAPCVAFGPWRVVRPIGVGGMGEVWLAERADGEFEQRVAIKQLAYPTPGLLARFRQERQILARLEHPNIARLIDGGVDAHGVPYLAMEYVEGIPIDEYVRTHELDLHAQLKLFLRVCDAVQYAHQNLVVHRDLKPSNILVSADGTPKLLDFGIAKVLATTDPVAATQTLARLLTPDYAAPEQFHGGPITTATDVYALGVVLYELLVGTRPPRAQPGALPTTHIDATGPPAPSAALDRSTGNAAAHRRALRGDLDRIALTALAHEPQRRYPSAAALAGDIRHFLKGRPISARGDSAGYRLRKFARRNRYALATAAIVFVVCVAATFISLQQARAAREQATRAGAVQAFISDLFRANSSAQPNPVKARETTARELLDQGAKKIDAAMRDAPQARLDVLELLGDLYSELALDDESVRLRRAAVALAREQYGSQSTELAAALTSLAGAMHASSAVNEREAVLTEATAILDRRRDFSSDTRANLLHKLAEHYGSSDLPKALAYARQSVLMDQRRGPSVDLAESLYLQGIVEINSGLRHDAAMSFQHAIEVSRAVEGDTNPSLPRFYAFLGEVQFRLLDFAGAQASAREALTVAIAVNGAEHVDTLQTQMRLGALLCEAGQQREGLALLEQAEQLALKIRGADDPFHTPQTRFAQGKALARAGRLREGLDEMELAIENRRRNRPDTRFLADMLGQSAATMLEMGRDRQARARLDESDAIYAKVGIAPHTLVHNANLATRIQLALAEGQPATAKPLLNELFVDTERVHGASLTELEYWLLGAEVDLASGETAAAAELAQRVRTTIEQADLAQFLGSMLARVDFVEGVAALRDGHADSALPLLQRALQTRQDILLPESPTLAEAHIALGQCLVALNQRDRAMQQLAAARAIDAQQPELAQHYRLPLHALQTQLQLR